MNGWVSDQLHRLWDWFSSFGIQLLWAVAVAVAISFGARWIRRRTRAVLERRRVNPNVIGLLDNLAKIVIYTIILVVVLRMFGVSSSSLATSLGLVTAAVTLSLQDVLKNFVSGIYLLMEQPFTVGDRIEVTNQKGVVQRVDIRTTILQNDMDELVLVPNYKVFSEIVLNRSKHIDAPDHYSIEGLNVPPSEIEDELKTIFAQTTGLAEKPPKIEVIRAGEDKFTYEVSVWWKPGESNRLGLVSCLYKRFPDAVISKFEPKT